MTSGGKLYRIGMNKGGAIKNLVACVSNTMRLLKAGMIPGHNPVISRIDTYSPDKGGVLL